MSTATATEEYPDLRLVPVREIQLTKVKVDKHHMLTIEYSCMEHEFFSTHTASYSRPAHEDLVKAFNRLTIHCCLMTEMVQGIRQEDEHLTGYQMGKLFISEDIYTAPEFLGYRCTGFTISNGGVVLVGQKKLRTKKVLNIVAPYEVLYPETPTGTEYDWLSELNFDLDRVVEEVKLYIAGKWNEEGRQLDMFEEVEKVAAAVEEVAPGLNYTVSVKGVDGQMKDVTKQFEAATRSFNGKQLDDE